MTTCAEQRFDPERRSREGRRVETASGLLLLHARHVWILGGRFTENGGYAASFRSMIGNAA